MEILRRGERELSCREGIVTSLNKPHTDDKGNKRRSDDSRGAFGALFLDAFSMDCIHRNFLQCLQVIFESI